MMARQSTLAWDARHVLQLRSALGEFFPVALKAVADLAARRAGAAPDARRHWDCRATGSSRHTNGPGGATRVGPLHVIGDPQPVMGCGPATACLGSGDHRCPFHPPARPSPRRQRHPVRGCSLCRCVEHRLARLRHRRPVLPRLAAVLTPGPIAIVRSRPRSRCCRSSRQVVPV